MAPAILLLLPIALLQAANPADSAVFGAFQKTDSGLRHFAVLKRTAVSGELDAIVAIGSPKDLPSVWWTEDCKIGLFLQEKVRTSRVYSLATKSGFSDCAARVERVAATDSVVSCEGEKSERYPNQKWVYDLPAKRLVLQFSYQPFQMQRVFSNVDETILIASDGRRKVAIGFKPEHDLEFRVLSAADSLRWLKQERVKPESAEIDKSFADRIQSHPLPQSTYDQFAAARPQRVKNGYTREGVTIDEKIGPSKLENDKLWFGKTFYDGEGTTGIGGFGYFSASDEKYHLFAPPEIAESSVSAIDVAPGSIWMALVHNGEWGASSGGLLRYDRQSAAVRRFECPDVGFKFVRAGASLLLATDYGLLVIEGDRVKRYFIDQTTDGRLRVAPATR